MQIENPGINSISTKKTDNVHLSNANYQTKNAETSGQKDVASLSEEARLLSKAHTVFNESENFLREDLVNGLKEQIESGSYTISVDQLAAAIMKHLRM